QNTVAADSVAPETDAIHGRRCVRPAPSPQVPACLAAVVCRLHARRMRAPAACRRTAPAAAVALALPCPAPAPLTAPRLAALSQALPQLRLLTDDADLEHYGRDWTRRWTPAPLAIALPSPVEEVQAIVRWARQAAVAIVPSGGRTGLSGGAVAANGELVLSLE